METMENNSWMLKFWMIVPLNTSETQQLLATLLSTLHNEITFDWFKIQQLQFFELLLIQNELN